MRAKVALVQEWPAEGIIRLRINTYREPGDPGYEEHHVQVPVFPDPGDSLGGYPGKKIPNPEWAEGFTITKLIPENLKDYKAWRDTQMTRE